jgi:hypothetical protein
MRYRLYSKFVLWDEWTVEAPSIEEAKRLFEETDEAEWQNQKPSEQGDTELVEIRDEYGEIVWQSGT